VNPLLDLPDELALEALRRAHALASHTVARTPLLTAGSLSARLGGPLALKAENLQRTGSFKLRGAVNKLRSIEPVAVVAGSAGNHAQSLAYAARSLDLPCEVFMPVDAAVGKLAAVRAFGAVVHQEAESVDECVELARARAVETGAAFVHPFDDLEVIAGQAGVGLEVLEQSDAVATLVVPVGGGGLIAGIAAAVRQVKPQVRVVGVQAELCAPFPPTLCPDRPQAAPTTATIADGIAIKRPGDVTLPLVRTLVDEVVTVSEDLIAETMALLLERSKLVVEGAGAASLAAVIAGAVELDPEQTTVVVLSGGNVDIGLLSGIVVREEVRRGRRIRVQTKALDRPGGLAELLTTIAATKANLISADHRRESMNLDVRETGIELTLETRGPDHAETVLTALRAAGYEVGRPRQV
jgi:threonine dehydratase